MNIGTSSLKNFKSKEESTNYFQTESFYHLSIYEVLIIYNEDPKAYRDDVYLKFYNLNVFHIEGGVIEYARKAKQQNLPLRFIGKNFIFDERLAERITDDIIALCHQCRAPCDHHTNCNNRGCHLLLIQCDASKAKYEGCCSNEYVEEFHLPIEE